MYTTCLFCDADLGRNEVLEELPVGRRVAFDASKGRLWVVCRSCERWNLTPVEERWEPIEQCERLFGATRVRVSTDHIGLAKLREGLELVRVGPALRPEFAAWRYGDQFGRRRNRAIAAGSVGAVAVVAAAPFALPAALTAYVSGGAFYAGVVSAGASLPVRVVRDYFTAERVIAHIPTDDGPTVDVRVRHLRESALVSSGGEVQIRLSHDAGFSMVSGASAHRALGVVLARSNVWGGSSAQVQAAVRQIHERGDVAGFLSAASRLSSRPGGRVMAKIRQVGPLSLTYVERLALEMALHEESERQMLEGELVHLADAWRQAEEIAAIADTL
jgi:hypothetical protein